VTTVKILYTMCCYYTDSIVFSVTLFHYSPLSILYITSGCYPSMHSAV